MKEDNLFDDEQEVVDDFEEGLLSEYREQRKALKLMIIDLEKLKDKIDKIFPDSLDKRYMRFFEEKVKSATGLFSTILDMRKEINKSIKDEFEIRRKMKGADGDSEDDADIIALAEKVEALNKRTNVSNKKIVGINEAELLKEGKENG